MFTTGYHIILYKLAVGELLWEILPINFILTENTEAFNESLFSIFKHTLRLVSAICSSFIQSGLITVIISNFIIETSTAGKSYNKQKSSYIIWGF